MYWKKSPLEMLLRLFKSAQICGPRERRNGGFRARLVVRPEFERSPRSWQHQPTAAITTMGLHRFTTVALQQPAQPLTPLDLGTPPRSQPQPSPGKRFASPGCVGTMGPGKACQASNAGLGRSTDHQASRDALEGLGHLTYTRRRIALPIRKTRRQILGRWHKPPNRRKR
jgi:hypothetical protein